MIEKHQVNVTALVPPAVSLWLQALAEGESRAQLASLKLLQVGGARLSATLAARIPAEIGCQLQQVFGMAEGLVNYTRLDDSAEKIIHTGVTQCVRTMKCGLPMPKEIHCRKGSRTPDDARSVHLPWLLQKPAAQCQRL